MDKATAELFAQVARCIGLEEVAVVPQWWDSDHPGSYVATYQRGLIRPEFDPRNKPADLKKIIDVLMSGEIAQVRIDHVIGPDGVTWFVCEIHPYSKGPRIGPPAPCYVTALCQAIAALPEVVA